MYELNDRTPKYMRPKLIKVKGEIDKFSIIVGDFNISVSN